MTEPHARVDPLQELQFALAEGDALLPPSRLAHTVLDTALASRPAGRPIDEPPPISAVEAFRRAVASLDRLLDSLETDEWRRPVVRGLDGQELVGHLIGVEHDFLAGLHAPHGAQADADHVASTDAAAAAQGGRPPSETLGEWRTAVATTLAALADAETSPPQLGEVIGLHGLHMPLGSLLIARTFELWTHEEDIRRATARPVQAPDAASLRLMTDLAVTMLPAGMRRARRGVRGRSARIVLTGPGGGTWLTDLDPDTVPDGARPQRPAHVRIVLDAVDFCRLVANRVDAATLAPVVTGDGSLAQDLFAGAASLALD